MASHTTQESLKLHFEKYGPVQDSILMVDRATGRSRCFGFITMQDPRSLDTLLEHPQILDGKKVDCKKAVPREQGHSQGSSAPAEFRTKKMFVGGLPPDVNEEVFRAFFEQFGEVEDSVVILDKETGRPRGFGFITFKHEESSDRVLANYEKNVINGKWVECKKATPKQSQAAYPSYTQPYMMYPSYSQPYYQDYYPRREFYPQSYQGYPQNYGYNNEPNNDYDATDADNSRPAHN